LPRVRQFQVIECVKRSQLEFIGLTQIGRPLQSTRSGFNTSSQRKQVDFANENLGNLIHSLVWQTGITVP
jgi:hypothetical protein